MSMLAGGWYLPLLFLCATKLRKVLCHFWWQKWRKSHAPHLWRRRESQSLKRMLRRQSVCRLRFFTALRLSPAATDESVASPPTMRSAGFRYAYGAGIKKDTREQKDAERYFSLCDAIPTRSVVRFAEISYICSTERLIARRYTYLMKVFSHCPYKKMWKFSTKKGLTNDTHILCSYVVYARFVHIHLILFKCGVLHRLFSSGFSTTFL